MNVQTNDPNVFSISKARKFKNMAAYLTSEITGETQQIRPK